MNRTLLILWIFSKVVCFLIWTSSVSSETMKPAFCMQCKDGCIKYGQSAVLKPLIPANLNLNAEVDATVENLKAGNNAGIHKIAGVTGIVFTVIGRAADSLVDQLMSGLVDKLLPDPIEEQLKAINQQLNILTARVEEMISFLTLRTIYNDYMPDRLAIRTQLLKLDEFRRSSPDKFNASKQNFLNSYEANGGDTHLHSMYGQARSILNRASLVTQDFRRVVVDFGNDIIMHVAAGIASYYVYSLYNGYDTRAILDMWNSQLISLQNIVTDAERQCMAKSTRADLDYYLWTIKDHGGCPYSNNEERAKSTFTALTDRYDWLMWSVLCYDHPFGPHSHDEDEISGVQYAAVGNDEYQFVVIYMKRGDMDITDDQYVWDSMSGQQKMNCDQVHSRLKSAGGALVCAESHLNVKNYRENNLGFHEHITGKHLDVWVTWVKSASTASWSAPQHTIEL